MLWKTPPQIKIYEALGTLADGRLELVDDESRVYSSSRNKFYTVQYDKESNAIMSNDNGSFYEGYLGYPAIAYLMKINELPFNEEFAQALKGIAWKDINVKNKNDFAKTMLEVDQILESRDVDIKKFHDFVDCTLEAIQQKQLEFLGTKLRPPEGY